MYLVSVIVPVYNSEHFLEKTIVSVMNQSIGFENIELVLVDDNSNDSSRKIIESYCKNYDNIVSYYSNENHGFPGFGRNIGIKLSSADYLMFLDNDDEYDVDMCKKLYETIIKENVDLVSCGRILIDHLGEIKDNYHGSHGKIHNNYIIYETNESLLFDSVTVWNKIFKKEIINRYQLKFLENSSADDFAFSIDYHSKCKKIIHLADYYGYKWNIRDESLSHDVKIEHIEEVLKAYNHIVDNLKKENKIKFADVMLKHMVLLLISKCSYLKTNLKQFKRILHDIYEFEKEVDFYEKLNDKFFDIPNKLLLHKFFYLTIFYLKTLNTLRKSNFLRKISRIIG